MAVASKAQVSMKPETLALVKSRASACEICRKIADSIGEGNTLTERLGIAVDAQKRHIKAELSKSIAAPAVEPSPASPSQKEERPTETSGGWPDQLSAATITRLKARIPKDEDSPGCFLCKWIVAALGPGNKLRDYHPQDDQKQFVVKSQKLHLALEFGGTEA